MLHRRHGDATRAFACFAAVLALRPDFAFTEFEIGHTCASLRQGAEALRWYRKAIGSAPNFVPAYLAAARTERALGHAQAALHLLDRALALEPERAELVAERDDVLRAQAPAPMVAAGAWLETVCAAREAHGSDRTLAVVTMVYDEPDLLPIWTRYYAGQVGAENCFVIDDGSDDGSAAGLPNVFSRPRAPLDEAERSRFVSAFCAALLGWYDAVLYCDVDEIVVADPARWAGLRDHAARGTLPVATTFGLNVLHRVGREDALAPGNPILAQRAVAYWASPLCKPLSIRRPVAWEPGFHSADAALAFDGLFNFHLPYVDLDLARRRQAKRRATAFSTPEVNPHQRVADTEVERWMRGWAAMPVADDVRLDETCPHYEAAIARLLQSERARGLAGYRVSLDIWGDRLWAIPERFRASF